MKTKAQHRKIMRMLFLRRSIDPSIVSLQVKDGGDWRTWVGPESVTSLTGIQYDEDGNPCAHNYIPNSEGVGGAVGVLPTGWSKGDGNGISIAVVGSGGGYTDVRFSGTATVNTYPALMCLYQSTGFTTGQEVTFSSVVQFLNDTSSSDRRLNITEYDPSNYLRETTTDWNTGVVQATLGASTTRITCRWYLVVVNGQTVDFTIRISKPQLSKSATKLTYTPTYGSAVFMPYVSPTKGLRASGAWTNLFTNLVPAAETKSLTAQKYCLQVFGTGASATCSYGTATESTPLIFTATAGSTTFTPTSCAKWMLVADSGYVRDYVPPGITNSASSSTTGGGGTNTALSDDMLECLRGKVDGVELITTQVGSDGATVTDLGNGIWRITDTTGAGYGDTECVVENLTVGSRLLFSAEVVAGTGWLPSDSNSILVADPGYANVRQYSYSNGKFEFTVTATSQIIRMVSDASGSVDVRLSIQRLLPSVFTAVAAVFPTVPSSQVTADTNISSVRGVVADLIYLASGGVIKSSDGTNTATVTVPDGWLSTDVLHIFVRTNAAGTQFQIGYQKNGVGTITWGSLAAYKGTMTPGTYARHALNVAMPMNFNEFAIGNKSLSDSSCLLFKRYIK